MRLSQGYHIHETGYHKPWLKVVVGDVSRMAALPPDVVMRSLLFQLRAFVNAGFRQIVVVTGHNGAQADLRLVATEFMKIVPIPVTVQSDPELVAGNYTGDHVGRFSQLMHCFPELVDLDRLDRAADHPLGRFAQGEDADEATAEYGEVLIETMIARVGGACRRPAASSGGTTVPDVRRSGPPGLSWPSVPSGSATVPLRVDAFPQPARWVMAVDQCVTI